MFSKGLLSAQHNITFYIFENSPSWGKRRPGSASASGRILQAVMVTLVGHPGAAFSGESVPTGCSPASPPVSAVLT